MSKIVSIVALNECATFKLRMTDVCNYSCPYCLHNTHKRPQEPEKDRERCWNAIPHIRRVCAEMAENTGKQVMIQLIGGEITIFSWLPDFMREITSEAPWLKNVFIVSNFHRPNDWWRELVKSSSVPINACMSYHPEGYKDGMKDFVNRLAELRDEKVFGYVEAETVYLEGDKHSKEFSELCMEKKIDCLVDADLREKGRGVDTPHYSHRKNTNDKYRVSFDDGTVSYFHTRNEFLKQHSVKDGKYIDCDGYSCSMLYDFVNCERDLITKCSYMEGDIDDETRRKHNQPAKRRKIPEVIEIENFHPLKSIQRCPRANQKEHWCTICGTMSLYKDGHIPENLRP